MSWGEWAKQSKAKQIDEPKTKRVHRLLYSQVFWPVGGGVEEAQELHGRFDSIFDSITSQFNFASHIKMFFFKRHKLE